MSRKRARADIFSPEKRSEIMRAVKGRDTKPEIALRKALFAKGFRYRLNVKTLPGKPDIVFPKRRAVIFVHGCFWHGHDCPRGKRKPKTNSGYWALKIKNNVKRDHAAVAALQRQNWSVKISWECDLKDLSGEANKIAGWLKSRKAQGRKR
ncbi:MAG TPA: very short patch repair endonuclease [Parvularculaceae bacterium]|nr:very short patch repair endonuclease [Parvularculaceae bacterium]HNS87832.1 very short patch repair endonuclease [Parvularculaceae bacterium]